MCQCRTWRWRVEGGGWRWLAVVDGWESQCVQQFGHAPCFFPFLPFRLPFAAAASSPPRPPDGPAFFLAFLEVGLAMMHCSAQLNVHNSYQSPTIVASARQRRYQHRTWKSTADSSDSMARARRRSHTHTHTHTTPHHTTRQHRDHQ